MEKPKGDVSFGERMKILREAKKRKSENQDLGGRVEEKSVAKVNKMEVDKLIELMQQAVLDLSLDVEYLMTQI